MSAPSSVVRRELDLAGLQLGEGSHPSPDAAGFSAADDLCLELLERLISATAEGSR